MPPRSPRARWRSSGAPRPRAGRCACSAWERTASSKRASSSRFPLRCRFDAGRARARSRRALPHHRGDAPARELRLEFRQREETHAGERARLRDAALRELAREQDGGHAGNLGAVLRVDGEMPFDARAASVRPPPRDAHQHSAEMAAKDVHPRGDQAERLRPALDRQARSPPTQQRREPEGKLLRADLERSAEFHRAHPGITLGNELEVRYVAGGGPPPPRSVEAHAFELLPAPRVPPRAAAPPLERHPSVPQELRDRALTGWRTLSRA